MFERLFYVAAFICYILIVLILAASVTAGVVFLSGGVLL
jgi:hypothetical protein